MDKAQPTLAEVQAIIAAAKTAVQEMKWLPAPTKHSPKYFNYNTALKIENEIREDLYFRAQYRGRITQQMGGARLVRNEHVSAGLYLARYRLLAYDLADRFHYNRVGAGLPYYRQSISGLHRHFWIDEGDGYAEPLTLTDTSAGGIIKAFLQESNITIVGGVKPVPREQYSLPL